MNKEAKKKDIINFGLFMRLMRLATPFRSYFFTATLLAIFLAIVQPARPALVQYTIDNAIINDSGNSLLFYIGILFLILFLNVILRYFFVFTTNFLGQSIIRDLRTQTFRKLITLKLRFFDKTPIGTATTRTINDIQTINTVFSQGIITIISDLLSIFAVFFYMFYIDWKLTLICLSVFPVLLYATYWFKESIKKSYQKVRAKVAELNAFLQEHITGMSIIQAFTAEDAEFAKFKSINADHRDANIQAIFAYSIFFPIVEIITAISLGLIVWFGGGRSVSGHFEIGVLISFIMCLNLLFRPLRMIADKFNTIQNGMIASERVFNILDMDEHIEDKGIKTVDRFKGDIVFDKVSFAYDEVNFVLKDISFNCKAGETIAIVGATGAGKSSIINILTRLYEIQDGSITIDGTDIRDYQLETLRNNIGIVLQDVYLFSGSIYENINLRDESISLEEVEKAAGYVGADAFIQNLPGQYHYNVMERGATLSVGQRQLIAFIRAFVQNPDILILDEATSSVDTESELLIQNATEKLVKDRTSIIIAHRLSTIQNADKIIVLDKGRIVESGSHKELIEKDGYYKELYDMQFSKEMSIS